MMKGYDAGGRSREKLLVRFSLLSGTPWGQPPAWLVVFNSPLQFSPEYAIMSPFLGKDAVVAVGCKGEP